MATMTKQEWSKPYLGVQHLGRLGDARWATVTKHRTFAALTLWARGVALTDTDEELFDTAEDARAAGEKWVAVGNL